MRVIRWLFLSILTLSLLCATPLAIAEGSPLDVYDAEGVVIGVPTGATAMGAAEARFPKAKIQYFTIDNDGYIAVATGKIDAFAHDTTLLRYACAQNPKLRMAEGTFGETDIAVGVSRKRSDLVEPINAFIQELIESGTRDDMLSRWIVDADSAYQAVDEPESPTQTLRVGTSGIVTPMTYYGEGGRLMGFDIELLARMGLALNAKIDISVMNYDALVAGLESGKLDLVVANLNITPERAERIDYTIPYMTASSGLVVANDAGDTGAADGSGIDTLADLQAYFGPGARVGVLVGSVFDAMSETYFPDAERAYYNSAADLIAALEAGKIEGYLVDKPLGYSECLVNDALWMPDTEVEADQYGVALAFGRESLRDQMNEVIAARKESGALDALSEKWFVTDEAQKPMEPLPETGANGTLVLSTDGASYPFSYVRDGAVVGYEIELFGEICRELGYGCKVEISDFAGVIASVASGKADAAVACISITEERKETMLFSEGTYIGGVMAILPASARENAAAGFRTVEDLQAYFGAGKRLGVQVGTIHDAITQEFFPDAERVYVSGGTADLIAALEAGKIDGYLADKPQAIAQCQTNDDLRMVNAIIKDDHYAMALSLDRGELCARFSEIIARMKESGELDALGEKWYGLDEAQKPMDALPQTGDNGTLRLITTGASYPFAYVRDGEQVGYEIELFGIICRELGYGCEVQTAEFAGVIAAVSTGKADVAAGCVSVTEERRETMLFTEPTYDGGVVMMVPADAENAAGADKTKDVSLWASISASFERTFVRESRWKLIVEGLWTTLIISVLSALLGTALGFGVCMMRRSKIGILSGIARVFVRIMQGTPIVVFLMILYYIVFGDVEPVLVAVVGFALNFGAYVSEMMRSGIEAVDPGQIEAASAIGFTRARTFLLITLPQAARHFLPVFRGEFISLVKMTSVVGYISIMDLTKMSDIIRSRTYEAFFPLIATAIIYFALSWALAQVLSAIELRVDPKRKKRVVKGVREEDAEQ